MGAQDPYRVAAAADDRIAAIRDSYGEQQSGRTANLCHNNYVWIAHPNGEWTNYWHLAKGSVTGAAHLNVGDEVKAGQYLRRGCRRLGDAEARPFMSSPAGPGATDRHGR